MMDSYEEFKKRVAFLKSSVEKSKKALDEAEDDLNELLIDCPCVEREDKETYYSGSYYDKAFTKYWSQCKVCGKTRTIKEVTHSHYG